MKILHGTWIPAKANGFINPGNFCVWIETEQRLKNAKANVYPYQLPSNALLDAFALALNVKPSLIGLSDELVSFEFIFPMSDNKVLPSLDIMRSKMLDMPEKVSWQKREVVCAILDNPLKFLKEVHFHRGIFL